MQGEQPGPLRVRRVWAFRVKGQVTVQPAHPSGLLSTAEAGRLAGVQPVTIRLWRKRGWLAAQGLDERGYPLHTREAVLAAERRVRENGLGASGVDPRRQRGRPRREAA